MIISRGVATLNELDTFYGIEDMYDMLEIIVIDSHNRYIANKPKNG